MKQWMRRMGLGLLACVVGLVGYLSVLHYRGNIHPIVAGEAYRSAQVTPPQIAWFRRQHGIASILNLRGAAPGAIWYEDEVAAAEAQGIVHADFGMSASRDLTQDEAADLVALMERLPKPILIHCRHGSDRTGLAAALYLAWLKGTDEETAEAALSIRYGHFAIPVLSAAWPMTRTFERLEPWMGYPDS